MIVEKGARGALAAPCRQQGIHPEIGPDTEALASTAAKQLGEFEARRFPRRFEALSHAAKSLPLRMEPAVAKKRKSNYLIANHRRINKKKRSVVVGKSPAWKRRIMTYLQKNDIIALGFVSLPGEDMLFS
jgi:hypothetical protein